MTEPEIVIEPQIEPEQPAPGTPRPAEPPRYPSFWNRMAGGIIGSCLVGVVTALARYGVFTWMPFVLAAVLGLFGWKVHPPVGVRSAAHDIVERAEHALESGADRLKVAREAMEAKLAQEKAALELRAREIEERAAQKESELARKAKEIEEKAAERAAEEKRSLALKAVQLALTPKPPPPSRTEVRPSERTTPSPRGDKTMVRLAGGGMQPNAKCEYCSALFIVGQVKGYGFTPGVGSTIAPITCPHCGESMNPNLAKENYELSRGRIPGVYRRW